MAKLLVGVSKIPIPGAKCSKKRYRYAVYRDVEFDKDGWADPDLFLPHEYELVYVQLAGSTRTQIGWWTGKGWDGRTFENEIAARWKRKPEDYDRP